VRGGRRREGRERRSGAGKTSRFAEKQKAKLCLVHIRKIRYGTGNTSAIGDLARRCISHCCGDKGRKGGKS